MLYTVNNMCQSDSLIRGSFVLAAALVQNTTSQTTSALSVIHQKDSFFGV